MGPVDNLTKRSGQAIVVVITILAMLFIVGLAFFALSQAERAASIRHLDGIRSRYIAEAGVSYAQKLLKLDLQANLIDSLDDITVTQVRGTEADLDGDGKPESRWFDVTDSQGNPAGRFALRVTDEASKLNLNSCGVENLSGLFSQLGIEGTAAARLVSARPFNAVEQAGTIVGKKDFSLAKNFLTVYSRDLEINLERKRRSYLNSVSAQVILGALLSAGINNAYQKAANIKDASDEDVAQTLLDKFVFENLAPSNLPQAGGWTRTDNFYEAAAGADAGKFVWENLPVEDGEYYCFLYAPSDADTVGEVDSQLINSGDGLGAKVRIENGSFSLEIKPAKDKVSRFSRIELAGLDYKRGLTRKVVTGTEALVINEIMVKPSAEIAAPGFDILPGQGIKHTFTGIKPGSYYVAVLAKNSGGLVGTVSIHGKYGDNLRDGDYIADTVNVDSSGDLTVDVKNNSLGTSTFKGIKLLQEPDAEFIEVLNLSPQAIDIGRFSFAAYSADGELIPGWPARVPEGTRIEPFQYLVFAVDNNDDSPAPAHLMNNGISFKSVWGFTSVGLDFEEFSGTIDKTFDLLPDRSGRIILRDAAGAQVDAVEYQSFQVNDFVSLERSDPTAKIDSKGNGFFDGWYNSEGKQGATPEAANDNVGMYMLDPYTGQQVRHTPAEVIVFNRKLANLAETQRLSTGEKWKRFSLADLSKMADPFAYQALEFDLAGHYQEGDFQDNGGIFESTGSGQSGIWEFSNVHAGTYLLSISSEKYAAQGQKILVSYKTVAQEQYNEPASVLFVQGVALYGIVELAGENLCNLQLKIISDSENKLDLKGARLEPVYSVDGRINVNTSTPEVLRAIFNDDSLVQAVLASRPIGIINNAKLGVGQLFLLNQAYLSFHDYLTVKSDVYEIDCRGEYYKQGKTMAYQIIHTVVERGE